MKLWKAIANGGRFFIQFSTNHTLHEDQRGQPIQYRSIEGAKKAADKLNRQMRLDALALIREARATHRVLDHINWDVTDSRLENLPIVTLGGDR